MSSSSPPILKPPDGCPLSLNELAIVQLVSEGMTYNQMAHSTGRAFSTIRTHVHNAMVKVRDQGFEVNDGTTLVLRCARQGWLAGWEQHVPKSEPVLSAEATLLGHVEQLLADTVAAIRVNAATHHITVAQRSYLKAFDSYLHAENQDLSGHSREKMSEHLATMFEEVGMARPVPIAVREREDDDVSTVPFVSRERKMSEEPARRPAGPRPVRVIMREAMDEVTAREGRLQTVLPELDEIRKVKKLFGSFLDSPAPARPQPRAPNTTGTGTASTVPTSATELRSGHSLDRPDVKPQTQPDTNGRKVFEPGELKRAVLEFIGKTEQPPTMAEIAHGVGYTASSSRGFAGMRSLLARSVREGDLHVDTGRYSLAH